jgi:nucleoside-diphosphate-sugar epimerase
MLEAVGRLQVSSATVTGASGLVGARLVEALSAGGIEVTAIVRDYRSSARLGRLPVRLVRADLRKRAVVQAALADAELVFHCAYGWNEEAEVEHEENLTLSHNVGCAVAAAGARLVHVSSMAVYGHRLPRLVDEQTPPRPGTPYGRTKLEIERSLRALAKRRGMELCIVRATKVFGPYDFAFTVRTVRKLLEGQLVLIEDGRGIVAPSYVDNLVYGLILAGAPHPAENCYVICDGVNLTWRELYGHIAKSVGTELLSGVRRTGPGNGPAPSEREYRDYMRRGSYTNARAERDLGYRPRIDLAEAIDRTAQWLRFAGIVGAEAAGNGSR